MDGLQRWLKNTNSLQKTKTEFDLIMTEVFFIDCYHKQPKYFDIARILNNYGYSLYDFYNFAYDENGQVRWGDAIFLPT